MATKNRRNQHGVSPTSIPLFGDIQLPKEDVSLDIQDLQDVNIDNLYKLQYIKTSQIHASEKNSYDISIIEELAESIARFMLLSPINLRKIDDDNYEIVSGHRRKLAYELIYKIYTSLNKPNDLESIKQEFVSKKKLKSFETLIGIISKNTKFEDYNCIPAFVFPVTMSDEDITTVLNDANITARHLTVNEGLQHIEYFLEDIQLEGTTLSSINKQVQDKFQNLGFYDWKGTKINEYISVHLYGCEELKKMFQDKIISSKNAQFISTFDKEKQLEIINELTNNPFIIDELKLDKKKKSVSKKKSISIPLLKKNILGINKSILTIKNCNGTIKFKRADVENYMELKTLLLNTKREVFDTLSSLESLIEDFTD